MLYARPSHNFHENYMKYIQNSVKEQIQDYYKLLKIKGFFPRPLFDGFINNKIYLSIIYDNQEIMLFFGNIKNNKSPYILSTGINGAYYRTISTIHFKKLPEEYKELLKNRGVPENGKNKTVTTLQRLVCASLFNIKNREIHHIDRNPENNHIDNLVPLDKKHHNYLHSYEYGKVNHRINFAKIKDDLIEKQKIFKIKVYASKYQEDYVLFAVCYYRYIKRMKITDITRLEGRIIPQKRAIEYIIARYPEFESYYRWIKNSDLLLLA